LGWAGHSTRKRNAPLVVGGALPPRDALASPARSFQLGWHSASSPPTHSEAAILFTTSSVYFVACLASGQFAINTEHHFCSTEAVVLSRGIFFTSSHRQLPSGLRLQAPTQSK